MALIISREQSVQLNKLSRSDTHRDKKLTREIFEQIFLISSRCIPSCALKTNQAIFHRTADSLFQLMHHNWVEVDLVTYPRKRGHACRPLLPF
jgi:hypothetical protein